jgi:hypothetical protein
LGKKGKVEGERLEEEEGKGSQAQHGVAAAVTATVIQPA